MEPCHSHKLLLKEGHLEESLDIPYSSSYASSSKTQSPSYPAFLPKPTARDKHFQDISETCSQWRYDSVSSCSECLLEKSEVSSTVESYSVTSPESSTVDLLSETSNTETTDASSTLSSTMTSSSVASFCMTLTAVDSPSVASLLVKCKALMPFSPIGDLVRVSASKAKKNLGPALKSKEEVSGRQNTRHLWPSGRCIPSSPLNLGMGGRSPVAALLLLHSLLLFTLLPHAAAFNLAFCKEPLGMESGHINDTQLTASSAYDISATGPSSARLNKEVQGGAWCPRSMVGVEQSKEFLEIDLKRTHVISATESQGRFGNGMGKEYVESYTLEYWRPDINTWHTYKRWNGDKILDGNVNTYTAVRTELVPPIIASKIRFVPYSPLPRTVCMRVEILGCPYNDGLVSYSMPQGISRGVEVDLMDLSYDGTTTEGLLIGGLGQLHDGIVGDHNFKTDIGHGKGYEWVGWKNESHQPLEIRCEFDVVRNFTSLAIFTNNMHTKEVEVFSRARVHFSVGGSYFSSVPVEYQYMPDRVSEYARNVTINLHHRVAKYVKVQMFYQARWIILSELFFLSSPAQGNFSAETGPDDPPQSAEAPSESDSSSGYMLDGAAHEDTDTRRNMVMTDVSEGPRVQEHVALIIGVLVAVIIVLVSAILFIVWRSKRQKDSTITHDIYTGPYGEKRDIVNLKLGVEGGSGGVGSGAGGELDKNGLYSEPFHLTYSSMGAYSTLGRKLVQANPLSSPDYTAECPSTDYAIPHLTEGGGSGVFPPPLPHSKPPHHTLNSFLGKASNTQQQPPQENFYAATEIVQGGTGSSVGSKQGQQSSGEVRAKEIPRLAITLLQQIGEGQFGEVHLGEVQDEDGEKQMVAVKTLRMEASHSVRCDFEREVEILAGLRDPNIVQVVGVCSREEPLCMLVEYLEHGDLNQFLQAHIAETASPRNTHAKTLSYGCLIYMATQIASGMKYLESLNFVHRDLATRNCLVGAGHIIKISDFGMSRSLYASDYYRIEGKALLPIRWMAWESILLGKFTTKSDVWSFAVTLWEILTMAREQPYEDLTEEQVIENVSFIYHNEARKDGSVLPWPIQTFATPMLQICLAGSC